MAGVSIESVFDLLADVVLLAVDAVQVDVVQGAGAVPGAGGHLGGRAGGVQPQGQAGMPQVARAAGERRSRQFRAERDPAGGAPYAAVGAFAEHAAASAAEQPPIRRGPELAQVLPKQVGQDRQDRYGPDSPVGTVLEDMRFTQLESVGVSRFGTPLSAPGGLPPRLRS